MKVSDSRIRVVTRLGCLLLAVVMLTAVPVAAFAVDDYPYAGTPGTDPWGFYQRYCTSFVAWRMNQNAGPMSFYNFMDGGHWGSAYNWAANARLLGYRVDRIPAVGSIAWWAAGTISGEGHVAYVEAVNANGTIIVEDYNYEPLRYSRRTILASSASGFIHFHDVPPDTTPPAITLACVAEGATYAGPISPAFIATDDSPTSVSATLDGVPFASCTTIAAEGTYRLAVTAIDASENRTSSAVTFTIDHDAIDPAVSFSTLAGADRYETAAAVSAAAFDSAACVVLTTGDNWPDALGGAALAGAIGGPILLTRPAALPAVTLAEIRRLGASDVVILGGVGAVSADVEASLVAELGEDAVTRIGGVDRYDTAGKVARAAREALGGSYTGGCLVATGESFPDSLAASPLAAAKGWPLVLVAPGDLAAATRQTMEEMGVSSAVVLGGEAAVAVSVETTLAAWLGDEAVTRIAGAERYETAARIADFAAASGLSWDGAAIATGQNFPDALAGGVLQGRSGSVLLLTHGSALVTPVRERLAAHAGDLRHLRYLGGEAAVSCAVKAAADGVVR